MWVYVCTVQRMLLRYMIYEVIISALSEMPSLMLSGQVWDWWSAIYLLFRREYGTLGAYRQAGWWRREESSESTGVYVALLIFECLQSSFFLLTDGKTRHKRRQLRCDQHVHMQWQESHRWDAGDTTVRGEASRVWILQFNMAKHQVVNLGY